MGFYIEGPNNLKVDFLIKNYEARVVELIDAGMVVQKDEKEAVVVVVENGPFDAAALAYDMDEFQVFSSPEDKRPKTFLVMSKSKAYALAGYTPKESEYEQH